MASITYPPEMLPSPDEGQEADVIVDGVIIYSSDVGCPMTLDDAVKQVEAANLFWALEKGKDGTYYAVVNEANYYLGDDLAGPGVETGATAADALLTALAKELENRRLRAKQIPAEYG